MNMEGSKVFSLYLYIFLVLNVVSGNITTSETNIVLPTGDEEFDSERKLTNSNNPKDVHLWVYSNPTHPEDFREIKVGDISSLERSGLLPGKVIILIDGWMNNNYSFQLKNGYLQQGVRNIVVLDYYELNSSERPPPIQYLSYIGGLKNVPKVGNKGADFIKFLHRNGIISGAHDVHIIGFSLGAHVAGSIGRHTQQKYKMKVGRITGLDPAGPFTKLLERDMLNKRQAQFLDVIHTEIAFQGTSKSLGHADFFINGGLWKNIPGCEDDFIDCAHQAAPQFYYKTITKEATFIGCSCTKPVPAKGVTICGKEPKCRNPTIVGEDCPSSASGDFYVKTNVNLKRT